MAADKYSATWVSHSSISDFLKCPRAYFLKHVYRDPATGHKVKLVSGAMALGAAVHNVIESLSTIETERRFKESLLEKFDRVWQNYQGKRGGFTSKTVEEEYRERGRQMLRRVMENPGPLVNLAIKVKTDLPQYWLSEADEIRLCGKIDWLEYLPDSDSVHIIDFKTSRKPEDAASLQLPIYHLLVHNVQQRKVAKASYWYLELSDEPQEQPLPDLLEAHDQVLAVAKRLKLARKLERFPCSQNGCFACRPMEAILRGEAELVGLDAYGQDMYLLSDSEDDDLQESVII
jgi:ATP-dependent helicase/DNAse subunit B